MEIMKMEQVVVEPSGEPEEICCICLDSLPDTIAAEPIEIDEQARIVLNCNHSYCKNCMKTYVGTKITNRQVEATQLICPLPECKCPLNAVDILKTTTEALFVKYLAFLRSIEFEKLKNGRYCVNPKCEEMIECNPNTKTFQCPKCQTKGCFKCGNASHPFQTCNQAMDRMYAAWENSMNKYKDEKAVAPCPSCSSRIWKNEGCQHMTCTKCRHEWCWTCGIKWSHHSYWMSQRFCQLQRILASRIWGPCLPVRVVTQTIGLTLAAAGVVIAGGVAVATALVAIPISLLYLIPCHLHKVYKRRQWLKRPEYRSILLVEKIQRGLHVYINDDQITDWESYLPSLTSNGAWRRDPSFEQYVAYVPSTAYNSFVVYLSSKTTTLLNLTPGYFRIIIMPSATTALPAVSILQDLVPNTLQTRQLTLVYQTDETMTPEIEAARNELELQRITFNILFVPKDDAIDAPEYMNQVYQAIFESTVAL